jgi:hypothetical protein
MMHTRQLCHQICSHVSMALKVLLLHVGGNITLKIKKSGTAKDFAALAHFLISS